MPPDRPLVSVCIFNAYIRNSNAYISKLFDIGW